ncbi:MAG: ThuA domain-containing protein [Armatimonadetes bacterium]|nr:ThuA domain-containing protein [Armatimonadota bacterium]MDE2206135.1 ThuA domain-containing protein [Armatimonadota bacterium]
MLVIGAVLPAAATTARRKKHILVVTVTKGFRHDSIPVAEQTIQELGEQTGLWDTDFVRTDAEMQQKMTRDALRHYDAVIFANTTGVLPLPDPQGFLDYIHEGHGFAAMHSGSDTFHQWPGQTDGVSAYIQMLGGEFQEHHNQSAIDIHIDDPNNPATRAIAEAARQTVPAGEMATGDATQHSIAGNSMWRVFDEIYLLKNSSRSDVHVLLSINHWPPDGSPNANSPGDHLIAWVKPYGKGRVFYTVLGHRQEVWRDPLYQKLITGGIEFVLGIGHGSMQLNNH